MIRLVKIQFYDFKGDEWYRKYKLVSSKMTTLRLARLTHEKYETIDFVLYFWYFRYGWVNGNKHNAIKNGR